MCKFFQLPVVFILIEPCYCCICGTPFAAAAYAPALLLPFRFTFSPPFAFCAFALLLPPLLMRSGHKLRC
jgi:hypothetical protein